jgi:hypothetical protein
MQVIGNFRQLSFIWISLIAIGLCRPGAVFADQAAEDKQLSDIAAALNRHDNSLAMLEPEALLASRERAQRSGESLLLKFAKGTSSIFEDRSECPPMNISEDNCRRYQLVADLPTRHSFVLFVNYYEGGDFLVVDDRTGRTLKISGQPFFNRDGDLMIEIDNAEAYGDPGIRIWHRWGQEWLLEWKHSTEDDPIDHYTSLKQWNNDQILLDFWLEGAPNAPIKHWNGMLIRQGKDWKLRVTWPSRD